MTRPCTQCHSENTYTDTLSWFCLDCNHEWNPDETLQTDADTVVLDANGQILEDGDTVTLAKDLKVKGSSIVLKVGTKIKHIRLVPEGDHNVDCKTDAGPMMLKSEFLKKVTA
jgi:protein PhnA